MSLQQVALRGLVCLSLACWCAGCGSLPRKPAATPAKKPAPRVAAPENKPAPPANATAETPKAAPKKEQRPMLDPPVAVVLPPNMRSGFGVAILAGGDRPTHRPLFFTRQEAWEIISEELQKAGVNLTRRDVTWADVEVPTRVVQELRPAEGAGGKSSKRVTQIFEETSPLVVDGEDPERKVAVKFVSRDEYFMLGGYDKRQWQVLDQNENVLELHNDPSHQYDFADAANFLVTKVKYYRNAKVYFTAFYDPAVALPLYDKEKLTTVPEGADPETAAELVKKNEQYLRELPVKLKGEAVNQLRQQVSDFVAWLKRMGAV